MQNWWAAFKAWLASPYQENMPWYGWFFFLGLLIVLTALWSIILKHLGEGLSGSAE